MQSTKKMRRTRASGFSLITLFGWFAGRSTDFLDLGMAIPRREHSHARQLAAQTGAKDSAHPYVYRTRRTTMFQEVFLFQSLCNQTSRDYVKDVNPNKNRPKIQELVRGRRVPTKPRWLALRLCLGGICQSERLLIGT